MNPRISVLALLFGLFILIALVAWRGAETIVSNVAAAGWGVLLLSLFHPLYLALRTSALQSLYPPGKRPRPWSAARAMWVGQAANALLPVATIGGDVMKARMLVREGAEAPATAGALIGEKTVQVLVLLLQCLLGIALLLYLGGDAEAVWPLLGGFSFLAVGTAGFLGVQRAGLFGSVTRTVARWSKSPAWQGRAEGAAQFDDAVRAQYRHPLRLVAACAFELFSHLVLAGEIWAAARMMGHPISLGDAVMLKVLTGSLRGAAFLLPGGLGVLEAGFILVGGAVGLGPDLMLAVSLVTRVRELVTGIPVLFWWQLSESARALRRRPAVSAPRARSPQT